MIKKLLLFFALIISFSSFSQKNFQFLGNKTEKQEIRFKLVNNLIVIPLKVNGNELSFILDTGVASTLLFNLTKKDSIGLNNVKKIMLRGLGRGEPITALTSTKNELKINNIVGSNQDLFVALTEDFNLSAKMGTTIHGIIGYDLLKDVITKINYKTKKIVFYNPKTYQQKKCRKCQEFPLEFYRKKPYVNVAVKIDTVGDLITPVKMLIDTGGTDAMWLFENTKAEIKTPIKYFKDILGEGLSGTIYGNRSKIPHISLGDFLIKEPTVSFLDKKSTLNARRFKERNGSIGGNILNRFKVWIDYPNKKMILKKNGSLKNGFYYNMSGLYLIHDGQELVKEKISNNSTKFYNSKNDRNTISLITKYHYKFKPSFKVDKVLKGSPAYNAGLLKGDIIKKINNKPAYEYQLNEITTMFQSQPSRKIKIIVKRRFKELKFEFRLKKEYKKSANNYWHFFTL
ncbi:aspartyl protease family protein [Tenacibaculum pacificus]|uniref:aspartyl protease family protein n=1 Tax=Tenacibaculum pacificus TaxID=3018314 RepID=UPI0022F388C3|nr:aspartyl protease family protein [Tenacibaculum pacificus]WBX72565.1 aspartyl protease family protein [Tenacibaculum pacificus]